jgi:hypothetical protein
MSKINFTPQVTSTLQPFATIAAIAALDDTILVDATSVFVTSVFDTFDLDKASTLDAVTAQVIVTASGTGRWIRRSNGSDKWRKQLTWYVNPSTGNDENNGLTSGTAIKTWAEFRRRHGRRLGSEASVDVYFSSTTVTENVLIDMYVGEYPEVIIIHGTRTLLYTGSVTGYQAWNSSAKTEPQITDSAIPTSWTASGLVQQQIVLTSGTHTGAVSFVAADLGTKKARVGMFYDDAYAEGFEPTVSTTFGVYSLTQFTGSVYIDCGPGRVWIYDVHFNISGSNFLCINQGQPWFGGCKIKVSHIDQRAGFWGAAGCILYSGAADLYNGHSTIDWSVIAGTISAYTGAMIELMYKNVMQVGTLQAKPGGFVSVQTDVACFGNTSNATIVVDSFGRFEIKPGVLMWGTGNTAPAAITVAADGALLLTDVQDITGSATSDSTVGGTAKTFTELAAGFVNTTNYARAVNP